MTSVVPPPPVASQGRKQIMFAHPSLPLTPLAAKARVLLSSFIPAELTSLINSRRRLAARWPALPARSAGPPPPARAQPAGRDGHITATTPEPQRAAWRYREPATLPRGLLREITAYM
jgi:hypothetical protein